MALSEIEKNAVSAAQEVFWRNGYDDTSVAQLVTATGLNRYALYNRFGGKLELFLAVLDAYHAERRDFFLTGLNDPNVAPIDAVGNVFRFAIAEMANRKAGCLICNIASEAADDEEVIRDIIQSYLAQIRNAYHLALERARERGELNPVITPEEGVDLLLALKLGIGAHARNGASCEALMGIFNAAIKVISWKGKT